jgi:signal transduction histidine kinase
MDRWFATLSIRGKVLFISLATAVLALVVSNVIILGSEFEWARRKALQTSRAIADVVIVYSVPSLVFGDAVTADRMIRSLRSEPKVAHAALYGPKGDLLAEYRREGWVDPLPSQVTIKPSRSFKGRHLRSFNPIQLKGRNVGTLYLVTDVSDIARQMFSFLLLTVVAALFSALVAYLFSRYAQGFVTRPVLSLTRTVQAIAREGDYGIRADVKGNDEIGYLAVWINSMMQQVQNQDETLRADVRQMQDKEHEIRKLLAKIQDDNVKLQKLDGLKNDFISTVSHELRTPLAAIGGFVRLVTEGADGELNPVQKEHLGIVLRNLDRLKGIVDELLDLSRLESGKVELDRREVRVEEVLKRACDGFEALFRSKDLRLEYRFDPAMAPVMADAGKIEQVIVNLVENAVKFTPRGGGVEIGGEPAGYGQEPGVHFWVSDDGEGIPPDKVEAVFDKFYQVEESTVRKVGGSGLGLAIVKRIVEAHGGRVWAENRLGRRGATFHVTLPGLGSPKLRERRKEAPPPKETS